MKKILSVILILAMLLSCCACSMPGGEGNASGKEEKRSYKLRQNNIGYERKEYYKTPEGWIAQEYLEISGLKDEEIQKSINQEIEDNFMEAVAWNEYPKYRGLMLELRKWEGIEPYSNYVNTAWYCNVGNVLSIVIDAQLNFEVPDADYSWLNIAACRPLNFDLNTGEQLKITDIFKDGVDGLKYINDYINDRINNTNADEEEAFWTDGWAAFKTVGAFPGITEDQKFYISSEGDCLFLVLDADTPWVELSAYSPCVISVPIGEVAALDGKYIKENIYTDESVSYILAANSYDPDSMSHLDPAEESNYMGINNLMYSNNMVYYPDMADCMIEAEKAFAQEAQTDIDAFAEEYGLPYKDDPQFTGWITLSSSVSRYGEYTSIAMSLYMDASLVDENWNYNELYSMGRSRNLLFKEGVEEPLKASDIFADGYDYQGKLGIDDSYGLQLMGDTLYAIKEDDFKNFTYFAIGCENLKIFE